LNTQVFDYYVRALVLNGHISLRKS